MGTIICVVLGILGVIMLICDKLGFDNLGSTIAMFTVIPCIILAVGGTLWGICLSMIL